MIDPVLVERISLETEIPPSTVARVLRAALCPTGHLPAHPWPVGLRIISVQGEWDEDGRTGPDAMGVVRTARHYDDDQGWTYDVWFPASGVDIVLDEGDPLNDPNHYRPAVDEVAP